MDIRELKARRASILDEARAIMGAPQLTADAQKQFDSKMGEADALRETIARADRLNAELATLDQSDGVRSGRSEIEMPAVNKTKRGDNEMRAFYHYLRTGDMSRELRASNDTDMNITTAADGGVTVPTRLFNRIIAKRNEVMLADRLGVLRVPFARGLTMDAPIDNGTANEFVATTESSDSDRDAPALSKVQMTLVNYTKRLELTNQLYQDEDAGLEDFLADYIGRAYGLTHNSLMVTEALASGTTNALAAAAAATASDIPKLVYALPDGYQDKTAWLMRRATEGAYRALTGNNWQFVPTPNGPENQLWANPIFNSGYVPAIGTGNKSLIFGNFSLMMLREQPTLNVLRDPYSAAKKGQVWMHYSFRAVYKLAIAEAIQYGTHP